MKEQNQSKPEKESPESPNDETTQEIKVAAPISVPKEGGWGWVVIFSSFWTMFIQSGVIMTFGALVNDIHSYFDVSVAAVALVNSIQTSLNFLICPFAAAFLNRYGFRTCGMLGAVISSLSIFISSFAQSYGVLLLFNGVLGGFGFAFVNMSSLLILGYYFERRRVLALVLATNGYSLGVMAMFPLQSYLVSLSGWRWVFVSNAGLVGLTYFFSLAYRPLLILTVAPEEESIKLPRKSKLKNKQTDETDQSEHFMGVLPLTELPTAADAFKPPESLEASSILRTPSNLSMTSTVTSSGHNQQLRKVHESLGNINARRKTKIIIFEPLHVHKKHKFWEKFLFWEKHHHQARPLYRDDAFYDTHIRHSTASKRLGDTSEDETGLENRLAMTRVVPIEDLQEKKHLCSSASRRVLATMLNVSSILKVPSFRIFCLSGFMCYMALYVPFVFITDRNNAAGLHDNYFVSVISFSSFVGKFGISAISDMIDPVMIFGLGLVMAGISTTLSGISYTYVFQYFYCVILGTSLSVIASLRVVCLVNLYGLSHLTNATGMLYMFMGLGSLIGTPIAGFLKTTFGYEVVFCVAGIEFLISGSLIVGIACVKKIKDERK